MDTILLGGFVRGGGGGAHTKTEQRVITQNEEQGNNQGHVRQPKKGNDDRTQWRDTCQFPSSR